VQSSRAVDGDISGDGFALLCQGFNCWRATKRGAPSCGKKRNVAGPHVERWLESHDSRKSVAHGDLFADARIG